MAALQGPPTCCAPGEVCVCGWVRHCAAAHGMRMGRPLCPRRCHLGGAQTTEGGGAVGAAGGTAPATGTRPLRRVGVGGDAPMSRAKARVRQGLVPGPALWHRRRPEHVGAVVPGAVHGTPLAGRVTRVGELSSPAWKGGRCSHFGWTPPPKKVSIDGPP